MEMVTTFLIYFSGFLAVWIFGFIMNRFKRGLCRADDTAPVSYFSWIGFVAVVFIYFFLSRPKFLETLKSWYENDTIKENEATTTQKKACVKCKFYDAKYQVTSWDVETNYCHKHKTSLFDVENSACDDLEEKIEG